MGSNKNGQISAQKASNRAMTRRIARKGNREKAESVDETAQGGRKGNQNEISRPTKNRKLNPLGHWDSLKSGSDGQVCQAHYMERGERKQTSASSDPDAPIRAFSGTPDGSN